MLLAPGETIPCSSALCAGNYSVSSLGPCLLQQQGRAALQGELGGASKMQVSDSSDSSIHCRIMMMMMIVLRVKRVFL